MCKLFFTSLAHGLCWSELFNDSSFQPASQAGFFLTAIYSNFHLGQDKKPEIYVSIIEALSMFAEFSEVKPKQSIQQHLQARCSKISLVWGAFLRLCPESRGSHRRLCKSKKTRNGWNFIIILDSREKVLGQATCQAEAHKVQSPSDLKRTSLS